MDYGHGEIGQLARVSGHSEDGGRVFLELRTGQSGWFESLDDDDQTYSEGEVVLLLDG